MASKRELTKAQESALERVKAFGAVMRLEDGTFATPDGRGLHGGVIKHLIAKGKLASNRDELFPEINKPQSYRPA